ncbi:hypothetical protein [Paenibacillus massiliensis]|uniref:hypothetical protein n=1 Tax=Paenibacillus massiliensis TaxID=225917 RepID=UPI0012DD0CF6|nr:hypothetical protein [Paenibacillus massiliensis]
MGTEKLLITPEVMENVEQTKVIPIVSERDEEGKEFLPVFLKSRIYIDLSNELNFEENYEKLVRIIENAPLYRRPPVGKRRVFEDQESINNYRTANIVRQMNNVINSNLQRLKPLSVDFKRAFLEDLEQLKLSDNDFDKNEIDEAIMGKLNSSIPIRDSYIEVVKILSDNDKIDSDWIIDIFEQMYSFTDFHDSGYNDMQNDQFKFLIQELFLYTCTILSKEAKYDVLSELTSTVFLFQLRSNSIEGTFTSLVFYLPSFERRNDRLNLRKVSFPAHIIMERVNGKFFSKQEILDCDLLLFYLSSLKLKEEERWFPTTYIYRHYREAVKILFRLKSKRNAERLLSLFGVANINELKKIIESYVHDDNYRYRNSHYGVPSIFAYIKPEDIAINP